MAPITIWGHFSDLGGALFGYGHLMSGTLITPQNQRKSGGYITPNPGTIQPPIPGITQSEPRSGSDNTLFDRKLPEYLLKQGVREKRPTKTGSGHYLGRSWKRRLVIWTRMLIPGVFSHDCYITRSTLMFWGYERTILKTLHYIIRELLNYYVRWKYCAFSSVDRR